MRAVCEGVAPRYDEHTRTLGHASSEPMMHAHIEACGLSGALVRFARCVAVDRTSTSAAVELTQPTSHIESSLFAIQ